MFPQAACTTHVKGAIGAFRKICTIAHTKYIGLYQVRIWYYRTATPELTVGFLSVKVYQTACVLDTAGSEERVCLQNQAHVPRACMIAMSLCASSGSQVCSWGAGRVEGFPTEPLAIVYGDVCDLDEVPVRVHDACFTSEVLGSMKCDCAEQLQQSLDYIKKNGPGIVIYLQQVLARVVSSCVLSPRFIYLRKNAGRQMMMQSSHTHARINTMNLSPRVFAQTSIDYLP